MKRARRDPTPRDPNFVLRYTLEGHTKGVASVKFSPNGKWIATAGTTNFMICTVIATHFLMEGADKLIKIWSAIDCKLELTLAGHTMGISDIAWSAADYLASASDDQQIRMWEASTVKSSG